MRVVVLSAPLVLAAGCHFFTGAYPCDGDENCPSEMACVEGACTEGARVRDAGGAGVDDDDGGRGIADDAGRDDDDDAGVAPGDAGGPPADAGGTGDGGDGVPDAGSADPDAGAADPDAGAADPDAGAIDDAGVPAVDAGSSIDVVVDGAPASCTPIELDVAVTGAASTSSDVVCAAAPRALDGPTTFTGGVGPWTAVSSGGDVTVATWPGGFGAGCPQSGELRRFVDGNACFMERGAELDATGYEALEVRFLVGFRDDPGSGDDLVVRWCCGDGCNPTTEAGRVEPAASGGTDDCRTVTLPLSAAADGCDALQVRFSWPGSDGRAGVDDVEIRGTPTLAALVETAPGAYATSLTSCVSGTIDVTCELPAASLTDTVQVVVP